MTPFDPRYHHRRSIRLKGYDYAQPGAYFVTVVTQERECLFGEVMEGGMHLSPAGNIAQGEWQRLSARFPHVCLDAFVVMPNHVHGIIIILGDDSRGTADSGDALNLSSTRRAPTPSTTRRTPTQERFGKPVPGSIPTIVRSYKSATTLRINYLRHASGIPVWQRNYYEHIVRNDEELQAIRRYILDNPYQWDSDDENPWRKELVR